MGALASVVRSLDAVGDHVGRQWYLSRTCPIAGCCNLTTMASICGSDELESRPSFPGVPSYTSSGSMDTDEIQDNG